MEIAGNPVQNPQCSCTLTTYMHRTPISCVYVSVSLTNQCLLKMCGFKATLPFALPFASALLPRQSSNTQGMHKQCSEVTKNVVDLKGRCYLNTHYLRIVVHTGKKHVKNKTKTNKLKQPSSKLEKGTSVTV